MNDSLVEIQNKLPDVYEASQFNKQDLFVTLQGLTGFWSGVVGKDPLSVASTTIGVIGHFSSKCNTGTLQQNRGNIEKWLTFGRNYAALKDSDDLDFNTLDVRSVPEVMKVN